MTTLTEDPEQRRLIISGGRDWRQSGDTAGGPWHYFTAVMAITSEKEYISLDWELPEPLADHCMVITRSPGIGRRLWVIGGSNKPQRYRVEVHARPLDDPSAPWTRMPDLLDARQWQGW